MINDLYPGEKRDTLEGFHVIAEGDVYLIDGGHWLECERCAEVFPEDAIEAAEGNLVLLLGIILSGCS